MAVVNAASATACFNRRRASCGTGCRSCCACREAEVQEGAESGDKEAEGTAQVAVSALGVGWVYKYMHLLQQRVRACLRHALVWLCLPVCWP